MRRRSVTGWILLAVILLGICVRVPACRLSPVPEDEQELYRDETGEPYLTEQDSYYYLRMARTMSEEGRIFLFNRRAEDPLMGMRFTADLSAQGDPMLLSVILLCVWKLLSLFFPVTLIRTARWIAPVLGALAAVPAFLYVRKRAGLAGGITAGVLAGLSIPFAAHTFPGFFDTDCLLAVVPLGMATAQMAAMQEKRAGRQAFFAALSGACFGILSLLWSAYYAYFWLIIIGGGTGMLLVMLVPFRCPASRRMKVLRGLGMTIAFSLLFLLLTRGTAGVAALGSVLLEYRAAAGADTVFPYVHRHTVEMKPLDLLPKNAGKGLAYLKGGTDSALNRAGGLGPCLMAAAGVPLAVFSAVRNRKKEPDGTGRPDLIPALTEAGMLLPWLAVGLKLTLDWRRCAEILVLPLSLLAGLGVGFLYREFITEDRPGRSRVFSRIAACSLVFAVCVPTAAASWQVARKNVPAVTDAKAEAMAAVRENEPEDAVIASWWDDGYFMQYTARRRALADGGSSSADIYWFLGKALLSEDPARMTGIFRMLETSGVSPMEDLAAHGLSAARAANLLVRTAPLSREEAEDELKEHTDLDERERSALLDRTHPAETKPILLALGSDLLKKTQVLCYFGSRDPETGRQELSGSRAVSKESCPAVPGTDCAFRMSDGKTLCVRVTEYGTAELIPEQAGEYANAASVSFWRDGACLREQQLGGDGDAVILVSDGGRLCAFTCAPALSRTLLVRLLVCGEKGIPGVEAAGEWYGDADGEACPTQTLLCTDNLSACGIRLWRLTD